MIIVLCVSYGQVLVESVLAPVLFLWCLDLKRMCCDVEPSLTDSLNDYSKQSFFAHLLLMYVVSEQKINFVVLSQ